MPDRQFDRCIATEHDQVRQGNLVSVFFLERPEQAARFVEVDIVWPAVEGWKALGSICGTTTTVSHAIGTGTVSGHPDKKGAIMTIVSRPPILCLIHQGIQVLFERCQIEFLEFIRVFEACAQMKPALELIESDSYCFFDKHHQCFN